MKKTIYLKSMNGNWLPYCKESRKLDRIIFLQDIFNWQKKGFKVVVVNGVLS